MNKPSCFSTKIDPALKDKLLKDLESQGFEISVPAYTLFSAKKKGVSCTLYESGSLTVQGKDMQEFIEFYLEPEILKEFTFSSPEALLDFTPRIGMDEAGKGDFFGPLCVAAVYANEEMIRQLQGLGVKDSKQLSDGTIWKIASKIKAACPHTVIRLFPLKYNELYKKFKNLNRLLGWTHVAALADLSQKTGCKKAILDQFAEKHVVESFLKQKKLFIDLEQKTKGEQDIVVAAASILARDAFVDGMKRLSEEVGMELPKGASRAVVMAARKLQETMGGDILEKTTKTHFKTSQEVNAQNPGN